ncbi:preQ(1) synthase [Chitinivibrio alkaliphilus]|uniref:NADPH-dependent 7-cyano-7-deazaguanine reductase n=1 Tax=Chitinivibrio alkaliphilus ACht1 TaxID=1313304 RepID=U7D9Y3_9BACT|nr:preQ(1) synthase [Chitinivibrio alkaliphilus]ERP38797.1 7-cyano-7-deazaguanine reductase [Chitinivibrio alkaliphilus ACht1]
MFYDNIRLLQEPGTKESLPKLEPIPSPMDNTGVVRIVFPEFTCVCPKTGYPDFGSIELYYQPDTSMVELKSWKLFLNAFRMIGTYHEEVTHFIFTHLCEQLSPTWAMVTGDFFPRGNVDTTVVFETPVQRPHGADTLLLRHTPHTRSYHG